MRNRQGLELAIIADDLTGALDAAAPFASRGLQTRVAAGVSAVAAALASQAQVISINTASREIAPEAAQQRVRTVLTALPSGCRRFKKADSRLKGNVEAELSVFDESALVVVPAIPEFGRFVVKGNLGGFGVPEPIDVAGRLGKNAQRASIPDTVTRKDVVQALRTAPDKALLVGARSLADALAETMTGAVPVPVSGLGDNLCMVIGSRDPITLAQIDALMADFPDAILVEAPNGILDAARAGNIGGRIAVVQAVPGLDEAAPGDVAKALADGLRRHILPGYGGVLISGGATAEQVLMQVNIGLLDVRGELLDGLPVSRAGNLDIITKSGGFGAQSALADAARLYLKAK